MHTVHKIINKFFQNSDRKYLEIGVYDGKNFNSTLIKNKISVDMSNKLYNPTHLMSSDDFFEIEKKELYDIIFIDGDHSAIQVIKDFNNSLKILNDNGVIFLHDLFPPSIEFTKREYCDDSYKILNYFIENDFDVLVDKSDFGSTCVFIKKKIRDDINLNLSYNEFVIKYSEHELIMNSYEEFEVKFKEKYENINIGS